MYPWTHHPDAIDGISVNEAVTELSPLMSNNATRKSCVFTSDVEKAQKFLRSYGGMHFYTWNVSGLTSEIKRRVEEAFRTQFDYVLVHIYETGNANINWHNDKESLFEEIVSVSLGASRKFRLRPLGQTSGWTAEYELGNGDVFHMHAGCQQCWEHTVPKETKVKQPRVNFTFRKFDALALVHNALQ